MRLLDCGRAINLYSNMVDEMNIRNLADLDRSCLGADAKEQIRSILSAKDDNRATDTASNLERSSCNGSLEEKKVRDFIHLFVSTFTPLDGERLTQTEYQQKRLLMALSIAAYLSTISPKKVKSVS